VKSAWLTELYKQWNKARGKSIYPRIRPFRRDWLQLLDAGKLHSAEDRRIAQQEAEALALKKNIKLHRKKARPNIILKIELPLDQESWLLGLFNQKNPSDYLKASLAEVSNAEGLAHTRFPELWKQWCKAIRIAFSSGKTMRPLNWKSPEGVREMLELIFKLTCLEPREGAFVREISIEIGLSSKILERRRRGIEACLSQMFQRKQMTLPALGIILTDSRTDLSGILTLHFPNGEKQEIAKLKEVFSLSLGDHERAEYATTPAQRVLTVENSKTTLRRLAINNKDSSTLLAACSFPTKALLRLLQLLGSDLPIYHFGDTDPAGYLILSKLRENSQRQVFAFLMKRRPAKKKCSLSEYDVELLPRLLNDPLLIDVKLDIHEIHKSGCKGDFEQETIGLPDIESWPFFRQ
jgi:hypothetical protein